MIVTGLIQNLVLFPTPPNNTVYSVSPLREFHYIQKDPMEMILEALNKTYETKPGSPQTPMICDISTIKGETPKRRHPNNSHNNGLNVDITYYGLVSKGSYSVGPVVEKDGKGKLSGPPTTLDVERQSIFLLELAKLDLEKNIIAVIAVDPEIKPVLVNYISGMNATHNVKFRAMALLYTGWEYDHYHHAHIRFRVRR